MDKNSVKKILKKHMKELESEHSVKALYLFGSYSRGQQKKKSDIDLLVEFNQEVGLFAFISLKQYLESVFKKKIDLVTFDALRPELVVQIKSELQRVA